ncbi:S9 family peptidase [Kangiella sp. TOML190]|uniref:alpha/beta hydrolase family protein n=1 Tax=Kangiella sp. TOML190 TaxID=2931351 RepID=UPI002040C2D9|nr:S9 family peptidase [Kangiella sp. TOML190]
MKYLLSILLTTISFIALSADKVTLESFAEKSKFNSFKISPDGKHIAFTYDDDREDQDRLAVMELATKKIKTSFNSDGAGREIVSYSWASNERLVMINQKETGWLDGQNTAPRLVAGNIDGSKRHELWHFQRADLRILSPLPEDPKHILVGKYHFTDKGGMKLNRMNVFSGNLRNITGSPKPHGSSNSVIRSISLDTKDVARAAFEYDPVDKNNDDDDVSYLHFRVDDKWELLSLPSSRKTMPSVGTIGFNKDNTKFYFVSNHDLDHDGVLGLFELDFLTKKIKFLFRHPDVDILGAVKGPNGEVIAAYYEAGYPDYYYIQEPGNEKEINFHKSLRASFKHEDITISSYASDGSMATLRVSSDRNPGDYYIFDRKNNSAKYLGSSMPHIKPKEMATVEPFTLTARDGLKMYGQMTIPKGKELKDLPLVVYPHGGPYGVKDDWRWDRRAQLLANNGYLVLQLNFRGSGGYGKQFREKGRAQWGSKMQDDLTDATLWAINQGYADKERVCIHGVSYGGYAALQAVVKEPDLYKCSIPDAGIYEIRLQWDEADSFRYDRAAGERYLKWMLGSNDEERIKERSPAYHVDKLKAALFLVHGSEDVRVPIENAYFLEEKLKEAGKPYEKLYKKDGHGFQKVEYRVELYDKMLKFLDKHIGE